MKLSIAPFPPLSSSVVRREKRSPLERRFFDGSFSCAILFGPHFSMEVSLAQYFSDHSRFKIQGSNFNYVCGEMSSFSSLCLAVLSGGSNSFFLFFFLFFSFSIIQAAAKGEKAKGWLEGNGGKNSTILLHQFVMILWCRQNENLLTIPELLYKGFFFKHCWISERLNLNLSQRRRLSLCNMKVERRQKKE